MNPNQDRKEALFETARQLASRAERAAYLDEACGDDLALRRQIEAMLETEAAADQYFRTTEAPGEAVREAALNTPAASGRCATGAGSSVWTSPTCPSLSRPRTTRFSRWMRPLSFSAKRTPPRRR